MVGGLVGYYLLKATISLRNIRRPSQTLSTDLICRLKRAFPALNLAQVRYRTHCALPPNWLPGKSKVDAMAFDHRIYFRQGFDPTSKRDMRLLIHELTHTDQIRQRGGSERRFALEYSQYFLTHGYRVHPLEIEAYRYAGQMLETVMEPCETAAGIV